MLINPVPPLQLLVSKLLRLINFIYAEGFIETFTRLRFHKGTPGQPVILASHFLGEEIAAFMSQAGHTITAASVNVIGLPCVLMQELGKIQIMAVLCQKIQPVIGIGAGGHIDIGAAADGNNALPADGIPVEGVLGPWSNYGEGPGIGPGFGIIRGTYGPLILI